MNLLLEDVQDLIAELESVVEAIDYGRTEEGLDELELQRGTIETMLAKAGR